MKTKRKYTPKNNFGIRRVWSINPSNRIHNENGKKYSRKNYKLTEVKYD